MIRVSKSLGNQDHERDLASLLTHSLSDSDSDAFLPRTMFQKRTVARSALVVLAATSMSTAAKIPPRATSYTLLAGGYTNVITTLTFDPAGKISVVGSADSGTNPSWVATHPTVKTVS